MQDPCKQFWRWTFRLLASLSLVWPLSGWTHDPVFAPGPHTLYKGGVELHLGAHQNDAGNDIEREYEAAVLYGLTGDWVLGIELPYHDADIGSGLADPALLTKYRFWREDTLAVQESAAVLLRIKPDSGAKHGSDADAALVGITYGYESLKWYRWAAARYVYNREGDNGLRRGDKLFLDAVIGIRPHPLEYRAPDWVWMLELNAEWTDRAERNGARLANTGGTEVFLSPGLMWTWRNFAIKPGIQIPVYHNLKGNQDETDYRAVVEFELHL